MPVWLARENEGTDEGTPPTIEVAATGDGELSQDPTGHGYPPNP
jgi:hypothetical protein